MNEKETLKKALHHETTDRPPCICPGGMMIEKMQDEEVWARALLYMLEHMDEWDRMGEVCRKRSRLFGLDAVGEKMEKIYKRLLGRESERG